MRLSIIVPVLNEAGQIEPLVRAIASRSSTRDLELILVDGGSSDGTLREMEKIRSNTLPFKVHVLTSPRGRAVQMNTGADRASGETLYFLHADTFPPYGFDETITSARQDGHRAGCFRMRFDSRHPVLMFCQWFTRFNVRFCRGGDQSLFIDRKAFDRLGGYNVNFEVYEDCEFIGRIYDDLGFSVMKDHVTTSARLYGSNGTLRLQYHFTVIHLKHRMGATPHELSRYYRANIRPIRIGTRQRLGLNT